MNSTFGLTQRQGEVAIGALIAVKIGILFVLASNSRFVMDEFVQFGWAKYLSHGLFETIWPAKNQAQTWKTLPVRRWQ